MHQPPEIFERSEPLESLAQRHFTVASLQHFLHQQIPLTRQMGIEVVQLTSDAIELSAPLAENRNDKGTAFGGSLASLMTLCGWSLLFVRLRSNGIDAELMIQKQQLRYHQPVGQALSGHCLLNDARLWDGFVRTLTRRGRARIPISAWVGACEQPAATMDAHYVAQISKEF